MPVVDGLGGASPVAGGLRDRRSRTTGIVVAERVPVLGESIQTSSGTDNTSHLRGKQRLLHQYAFYFRVSVTNRYKRVILDW